MKKIKTLLIGSGGSYDYHLKTLETYSKLFEIIDTHASLDFETSKYTKEELDLAIISVEDPDLKFELSKNFVRLGINIMIEKPIVFSEGQIAELQQIKNKSIIYGSLHAKFSSLTHFLFDIYNEKIDYIEMKRTYPSSKNRSTYVNYSSWYNSFSEISLFGKIKDINKIEIKNESFMEEHSTIEGQLENGVKFKFVTDWTTELDSKMTIIESGNNIIKLNYSNQEITISGNISLIKNFSDIGDRVEHEYIRMYLELYDVINGIKKDNFLLIKEISQWINSILNKKPHNFKLSGLITF